MYAEHLINSLQGNSSSRRRVGRRSADATLVVNLAAAIAGDLNNERAAHRAGFVHVARAGGKNNFTNFMLEGFSQMEFKQLHAAVDGEHRSPNASLAQLRVHVAVVVLVRVVLALRSLRCVTTAVTDLDRTPLQRALA